MVASERRSVSMRVNRIARGADVEPRLLLVDFIRDVAGQPGTHIGCDEGICGACTVDVDGETVKSCLMFAVQADGCDVTTIEGVSGDGGLGPLQQAFSAAHALQCGYCTPGMVMSARALLRSNPNPSEDDIRRQMVGNLCRCTGYQAIVAAVQGAAIRESSAVEGGQP